MPVYEYQCTRCSKSFEFSQKMSEPPKTDCPQCEGKLQRLISMTSFQLKGSGWYTTDYSCQAKPKKEEPKATACETNASSCDKPVCPNKENKKS